MGKKRRAYLASGFYAKTTAVVPAADTAVGEALRERREALIADLGGRDECSTAQLALVDLIVAAWWQLESVTAYLLTLPALVDKRRRRVWQVVRDRATLATQLQSLLRDVGLERRARDVDIAAQLAATYGAEEDEAPPRGQENFADPLLPEVGPPRVSEPSRRTGS